VSLLPTSNKSLAKSLSRPWRRGEILLIGYYGFSNFGDEIALKLFLKSFPKFNFSVLWGGLSKTPKMKNFNKVSRGSLRNILREISKSQAVVFGPGSLFQTKTSIRSFFYYLFLAKYAVRKKKPLFFYSQGIGPVNSLCFWLLKKILNKAQYIGIRDKYYFNKLKKQDIAVEFMPDIFWEMSANPSGSKLHSIRGRKNSNVLLIFHQKSSKGLRVSYRLLKPDGKNII